MGRPRGCRATSSFPTGRSSSSSSPSSHLAASSASTSCRRSTRRSSTARRRSTSSSTTPRRPRQAADAAEEEYKSAARRGSPRSGRMREDAREQGAAIIAEMREQAADRGSADRHERAHADRGRASAGRPAAALRGRRHGDHLGQPDRRGVARGRRAPRAGLSSASSPTSRARRREPGDRADPGWLGTRAGGAVVDVAGRGCSVEESTARRLGTSCSRVAQLLDCEPTLRRALTEPAVDAKARSAARRRGCSHGKISDDADAGRGGSRRARAGREPSDLADALEPWRVLAYGDRGRARNGGQLDALEDELFRFGRILRGERRPARRVRRPHGAGRASAGRCSTDCSTARRRRHATAAGARLRRARRARSGLAASTTTSARGVPAASRLRRDRRVASALTTTSSTGSRPRSPRCTATRSSSTSSSTRRSSAASGSTIGDEVIDSTVEPARRGQPPARRLIATSSTLPSTTPRHHDDARLADAHETVAERAGTT